MKTIARFQRYVPFETLLQWATLNGAEALGFEKQIGRLEVGKKPGILPLSGLHTEDHPKQWHVQTHAKVMRLV